MCAVCMPLRVSVSKPMELGCSYTELEIHKGKMLLVPSLKEVRLLTVISTKTYAFSFDLLKALDDIKGLDKAQVWCWVRARVRGLR